MLRALVALLLAANLAFFAWTQGWLDDFVGVRASGDREPERLARQVNPGAVVILSAASDAAAAPSATCLEAGPFDAEAALSAENALRGIAPPGSWIDVRTETPGSWLVYMGSYADRATLLRKEAEIGRVDVEFEEVSLPTEGEFGLSLGRFDDRAAAERGLAEQQQHGIRTARVVQAAAPSIVHTLRVERAPPALAAQLTGANAAVFGKPFAACTRAASAPR
ncbi:MAG: hypothetical protein ABI809_05335 [Caldimonas sp.]